jgi:hypothetical protein
LCHLEEPPDLLELHVRLERRQAPEERGGIDIPGDECVAEREQQDLMAGGTRVVVIGLAMSREAQREGTIEMLAARRNGAAGVGQNV